MKTRTGRVFKDRDYLLTKDGLFFCVLGCLHPTNRVLAYLKYRPSPSGKWGTGSHRFERAIPNYTVPAVLTTIDYLEKKFPYYVFEDKTIRAKFSAVPLDAIESHFCPESLVQWLLSSDRLDKLQKKAVALIRHLSRKAGIDTTSLGVTGSLLIGIHKPRFSDIDLVVYGSKSSLKIREALRKSYSERNSSIRKLEGQKLRDWCHEKSRLFQMTIAEAEGLYRRTWNRGEFQGTLFSVHPVRDGQDLHGRYGETIFHPLETVTMKAEIRGVNEAIFLPAIYEVEKSVRLGTGRSLGVTQLASYEGLYCDVFKRGDTVIARGLLEKVIDRRRGKTWKRLLIGSAALRGRDYVRPTGTVFR